jgi:two-component system chemotaxis response regulator CheB
MLHHDIIAIGGSAGNVAVLKRILADLPADLPAAVLITTHIPAMSAGYLADALRPSSTLPVVQARDGQAIEPGHVYVARPDRHLLIVDHTLRLGFGPRENMARPAIDPMFRSVALAHGPRAIGVVLTGYLNDGAAGLCAIKQAGGVAVVQHPADAEVEDMPLAALQAVEADHVAAAAQLGVLLSTLVREPPGPAGVVQPELELEVRVAAGVYVGSDKLMTFARPSTISCPSCHGVLSEVKDGGPLRYRCQTGHAYTADAALRDQEGQVDEALRLAMRLMEERHALVERMGREARAQGRSAVAELYEKHAEEYRRYAQTLRRAAVTSMEDARRETG